MMNELDLDARPPVDTVRSRSFAADVFVVEWEVAADSPTDTAPEREQWWRNEGVAANFDG